MYVVALASSIASGSRLTPRTSRTSSGSTPCGINLSRPAPSSNAALKSLALSASGGATNAQDRGSAILTPSLAYFSKFALKRSSSPPLVLQPGMTVSPGWASSGLSLILESEIGRYMWRSLLSL